MMENLVKPIIESLELLRGPSRPAQADAPMETNTTSGDARPSVMKDTPAQIIDEYIDREHRKCNIIVHNMGEESSTKDHEKVHSLFETEFNVPKSSVTNVLRLGKPGGSKARLLLVTLSDEHHKRLVMKQASKLQATERWNNIYVTPDLTIKERETNKALREELKRRKDNGEKNLIIKRGRIVTKNGASQSSN